MTKKEQIAEKIKQLKAQLSAETVKESQKLRKDRTRALIQIGAMLMADKSPEAIKLVEKFNTEIERAKQAAAKKEPAKKPAS